jgi:HAD superfamily hydrolase (TIGR01509 family)
MDFDGTMADSLGVLWQAYSLFAKRHGFTPTKFEFQSLNGPPLRDVVRILLDDHSLQNSTNELEEEYSGIIQELYLQVPIAKGGRNFLEQATRSNCRVGIVTSNSTKLVKEWLLLKEIYQFVDFIVSCDDVQFGKPHPSPYLLGIEISNFEKDQILAIEDSLQGVDSALAAGLGVLMLSDGLHIYPNSNVIQISSLTEAKDIVFGQVFERNKLL